jgi:hypothetical protein
MRFVAAFTLALILGHHAQAQSNVVVINGNHTIGADKPQTLNVTFQLSVPAPDVSSSQDMTKAMASTSGALYDIVNHECDVLTAALKGTCRLVRLNIGGNYNDPNSLPNFGNRPNIAPIISASANATFEIGPQVSAPAEPTVTPATPAKIAPK